MYYVKSFDNITYFHPTSNLVTYERKTGDEIAVFIPDFFNASYKLVKFSKLNIINKSKKNLLVKTVKDKLYFISLQIKWHDNKRYIAGIDVKNGKPLFMISKEGEILSDLLYIVNRNIIPILQVTKHSISIHLVDLSIDKVWGISWNMMNIKQLMINLLRLGKVPGELKKEIMEDEIKYFYVYPNVYHVDARYDVRHTDGIGTSKDLYANSVTAHLGISVYGEKYFYSLNYLSIKIEADNDKIVCYWDVADVLLRVYKKVQERQALIYEFYFEVKDIDTSDNDRMLQRSYSLRAQTGYSYISTDLYENDCYYIQQNGQGIMIKEKSRSRYEKYYSSSLYRYGKHLVIIQNHIYSKMVFINTEKNLIYKFAIYTDQHLCPRYRYTYHYYPVYKVNKLFFLSKDLQCLMIVDMNKVEYFINLDGTRNCEAINSTDIKEKYASIEKVAIVLDVKEMIIKAIQNKYRLEVRADGIKILEHQVDKGTESLYIIAKYIIQDVENIGVFKLDMLSSVLQLNLSSFHTRHPQNPAVRSFTTKNNYFRFISNFDLYKLSFDRGNLSNVDIYYKDAGVFVSIKYNRASRSVMKGYYDNNKLVTESLNNLIIMKYECSYTSDVETQGTEYSEVGCRSSYGLLVYDLVLVQKMPAVSM